MSTLSVRARIGFWLSIVLALADIVGAFIPPPPAADGPPVVVQALSGVLGVVTLVGASPLPASPARPGHRPVEGAAHVCLSPSSARPGARLGVSATRRAETVRPLAHDGARVVRSLHLVVTPM